MQLIVTTSTDYTTSELSDVGTIRFQNPATAVASFLASQFDDVQILSGLRVVGSSEGANIISVTGGSLNISAWRFTNWLVNDSTALTGTAASETFSGSAFTDRLTGLGGSDRLFGRDGQDEISGGEGGDVLAGGLGYDTLTYLSSIDGVTVNLALNTAKGGDAEGDVITGFEKVEGSDANDNITGNDGDNELFSRLGDDRVFGMGGDDFLSGNGGSDALFGGDGDDFLAGSGGFDVLNGGLGYDIMNGGNRADRFVFTSVEDSPTFANADLISDFSPGQGIRRDTVDLRQIDAIEGGGDDAFTYIGETEFSGAAGELRIKVLDDVTLLRADTDGDGKADFTVAFTATPPITVTDFFL